MINLGFTFEKSQLFTLGAIAGLTGATLRIPSSFMIRIAGGRNVIFLTTAFLMIPAFGAGVLMTDPNTPLWKFQIMALLSGFGGGNFASSMSNISFFFPKKVQGMSLGLNAGLGNFGVTTMQILIPLAMTVGFFGLTGDSQTLVKTSGTLIGKIPAGSETWLQNGGFVWLIFLVPLAFAGWFGMNNIRTEAVSPDIGSTGAAFGKIIGLLVLAFATSIFGLTLLLKFKVSKWIVVPIVIALTLFLMKLIPGSIKPNLQRQFKIFSNKHTWVMTVIYIMTFGSFIGYAASFPLCIKVIFGFKHILVEGVMTHNTANPDGPSALSYAWMGPFIGALIRPVGGWISDRMGGAFITQLVSIVMIISALGASYYMSAAYKSETPQDFFLPFFIIFLILFAATGIGNGSTFRTIAMVFDEEQAGPVLGFTSAVAAYGAFIMPKVFGEQIKAATPEYALYGFATFYFVCLVLNWWFYLGPKADIKNP
jgi:NNP family nitrate/nitrite transporter-like MFS transporter